MPNTSERQPGFFSGSGRSRMARTMFRLLTRHEEKSTVMKQSVTPSEYDIMRLRSVNVDSMLTYCPRSIVITPAISAATMTPSVTPTSAESML